MLLYVAVKMLIGCQLTQFPLSLSVVQETVIGVGVFMLTILAPSGWILAHLEDYKKKV